MVHQELNAFIVVRERREKVLALLVDDDDGAFCPLMRGFLNGIGKAGSLEGIEHQDQTVKVLIRNERIDGGLALLAVGAALVFLIRGKDQDIPVISECLFLKTANEFGLIVFVGLADKYRDPFASSHQYPFV